MKKKSAKKIISLVLAVSLALGLIPLTAMADDTEEDVYVVDSGVCGENVTWTYTSDATLTISGSGAMYDYDEYGLVYGDGYPEFESYEYSCTSLIIENGITHIGGYTFYGFSYISSVEIPDSVVSIGNYAFCYCYNLETIEIPDSVVSIGDYSFAYVFDTNTVALKIGSGLEYIGENAFLCSDILTIEVSSENQYFTAVDDVLYSKDMTELVYYAGMQENETFTLPASVTSIRYEAFRDISSDTLISVNVEEGNTSYSAEDGVLFNFDKTELVYCPASRTEYTIPDSVITIKGYAFYYCRISSITFGQSVEEIGEYAFYYCRNLQSVSLNEGLKTIGDHAFYFCNAYDFTTIEIPDSVVSIEDFAFCYCTHLSEVIFGENSEIVSIGRYVFAHDDGLKSVDLTNVEYIGDYAFYYAENLRTIILGTDLKEIGYYGFYVYHKSRSINIYYAGSKTQWEAVEKNYIFGMYDSKVTIYYYSTGAGDTGAGDFNEAEITLSSYSFMYDGTEKEPEVTVVLDDEELTFNTDYYVYYLDNVEVGTATAVVYGGGDYEGEVDIEFEITNPSGTLDSGLSWYLDVETGILTISGNGAMDDFDFDTDAAPWYSVRGSITEVIIEDGVTSIGSDAFYNCSNLTYVTIPDTVVSIGESAFYNCSDLYSVTIPDGVTSIESGTFASCEGLNYILISESVTYIADDAFSGSENILDVYYPGTESSWNEIDGHDNYELSLADFYFESNGERLRVSVTAGSSSLILGTVTGGYVGCYVVGILSDDYTEFICTISDSNVISVDLGTFNSSYGQYFTVSAEAVGNTSLAFTNPETGQASVVYLTVNLEESAYSLDTVPQMTIEEGKVTNFYNYEGLVVDDFAYTANYNSDGDIESYTVTMTVYNSLPIYAAVTTFDANGDIYDFAVVDRFDTNTTSLWDTIRELDDDLTDLYYLCKNSLYYSGSTITKMTEIEVEVPAGGSIEISNSMQSVVPCYANLVWLLIETGTAAYSLGTTAGDILSSEETKLTIINSVIKSLMEWDETNNPVTKKLKSSLKSAVNDVFKSGSVDYDNCTELVESFCDVLEETGIDLIETITESILSVSGLGNLTVSTVESMLLSAIPTGNIVKLMFNIYEMEDVAIAWATFADSIDFGDGIYIYAYSVDGSVYSNGVNVTLTEATAEDYDIVVHAYLVVDSSEVEITDTIDAASYETYSITLYKNGEAIQAEGDVTVKIPVSSSGTVTVYRVEDDGSLTKMDAVVEDGYAVFTTDHFSYYILAYSAAADNTTGGSTDGETYEDTIETVITELYGSDRYETMQAIAEEAFLETGSTYAVIATGENYPDALAAASLAGVLDAPVILVNEKKISVALETLEELNVESVYIVGGAASVSEDIAAQIEEAGISVERIAGDTRQETALKIAEKVKELSAEDLSDTCLIAAGRSFPDALSGSPYSYWSGSPIYLAENDGSVSEAVIAAIEEGGYSRVIILGGEASVSAEAYAELENISGVTVTRLGGETRYETSVYIAVWSVAQGMSYDGLAVAAGTNYPDALCGAALCGQKGSVLLLANTTAANSTDLTEVLASQADTLSGIYIIGGTSSVSAEVREEISSILN